MNSRRPNRTVLITGSTSGIGYALASTFARNKFDLVLVSRNSDRLKQQERHLKDAFEVGVHTIARDLSDTRAAEQIFAEVRTQGIHIDILVNNAGLNEGGPFAQTSPDRELQILQVHIITLTRLTKLFLPDMLENKYGRILNLGSTGSFAPCPLDAVYCASKAYVLSFSCALRAELSRTGVTVSTLCPGPTRTEFARKARMESTLLFRRFVMDPKDVAEIAYRGLMKNKRLIIPGLYNRLMVLSLPFTPAALLERIGIALLKRR